MSLGTRWRDRRQSGRGRHRDKSLGSNHCEFVASWASEGPDPPAGLLWGPHENVYVKVTDKLRDRMDGNVLLLGTEVN